VDGLTRVLAIEILTAARALDLRAPLTPAPATAAVVQLLRTGVVPGEPEDVDGTGYEPVAGPGPDRFLAPEIETVVDLVADGAVRRAAESVTGPLH
jgi:histidine ammonia-lyase